MLPRMKSFEAKLAAIVSVLLVLAFAVSANAAQKNIFQQRTVPVPQPKGVEESKEAAGQTPDTAEKAKEAEFPDFSDIFKETLAQPSAITIPTRYGTIKETRIVDSNLPTIVHIQDVHTNYEAQKNEASIVEHLINEYKVGLVLMEGGCGDVSLTKRRSCARTEIREEVAEKYLKDARINGIEYLNFGTDYPMMLWGIETPKLYDEQISTFMEVDAIRAGAEDELKKIGLLLANIKPKLYPTSVVLLEKKKADYEAGSIKLSDYQGALVTAAKENGVDIAGFPNITAFLSAIEIEPAIEFAKVAAERDEIAGKIRDVAGDEAADKLNELRSSFIAGTIKTGEYYNTLAALAHKADIDTSAYKNLESYTKYIALFDALDNSELFREEAKLEDKVKDALLETPEAKQLAKISKAHSILSDMLYSKITPDEWAVFQMNKADYNIASWREFLNAQAETLGIQQRMPIGTSVMDANLKVLEKFYQTALKRDNAFVDNSIAAIKKHAKDAKVVALVAGGFHTPRLTQLFKDKGISYIVVTPKITTKMDSDRYFKALKTWTPLVDVISKNPEKYGVSPEAVLNNAEE